jgi:hypothetical protein
MTLKELHKAHCPEYMSFFVEMCIQQVNCGFKAAIG